MDRSAPLLALAVLTAGCAGGGTAPTAALPTSASATVSPSSSAAAVLSTTRTGRTARAIYYLHDGGQGPRLYREFHLRAATTGVIRDAVTAMLTEPADDGDYTSLWPKQTRVLGARVSGTTAYVDLSAAAKGGSAGAEAEAQSLQQLVHTVTAAAPSVTAVQLLIEGAAPETLWGHADTSRPIARGAAAEVLGPVWVTVPRTLKQGGTFGGEASVFEATVSWELRQGGRIVRSGHTNASAGAPGRGSWSATAQVPPGRYVLRAYESSAKDGTATHIDDKPVNVTA